MHKVIITLVVGCAGKIHARQVEIVQVGVRDDLLRSFQVFQLMIADGREKAIHRGVAARAKRPDRGDVLQKIAVILAYRNIERSLIIPAGLGIIIVPGREDEVGIPSGHHARDRRRAAVAGLGRSIVADYGESDGFGICLREVTPKPR
ncbi:hypothetical protein DIM_10800 [Candidatus Denitrolinea symbiosum]|nr:hypothetical protein DIM_10800 [Candidatus Denitrolinea symbiosum]